jgi:hypothetical protein
MKPTGLGDTIKNITSLTGIDKVVNKISDVTGVPCGCSKRQEALNDPNLLINKMFYYDGIHNERGPIQHGPHTNI